MQIALKYCNVLLYSISMLLAMGVTTICAAEWEKEVGPFHSTGLLSSALYTICTVCQIGHFDIFIAFLVYHGAAVVCL